MIITQPQTSTATEVLTIRQENPFFEDVISLGKKNSKFLGHFPRGAYEDSAQRNHILGAVVGGKLVGYLLYRISRGYAAIVHLCVSDTARGQGITRVLFESLKTRTQECQGIILRCRRDYPANSLWPKLDFIPTNEIAGRSDSGLPLTIWLYDFGQPSLFSQIEDPFSQRRIAVALDANVLFDLQDPDNELTEESKALQADWLNGELEFCVTDEIFHEINRSGEPRERTRRRAFAQRFRTISVDSSQEEHIVNELRSILPSPDDLSDVRHLAKCIVAGIPMFVTRDDDVLAVADRIQDRFGLSVVRPCELVGEFDERIRRLEYAPARMAGSLTEVHRPSATQIGRLVRVFQDFPRAEPKSSIQRTLRQLLATPVHTEAKVVRDPEGEPLALYAAQATAEDRLSLEVLRVRPGPLRQSLVEHILWTTISGAAPKFTWFEVRDAYLASGADETLQMLGFVRTGSGWVKLAVRVTGSLAEVREAFDQALNTLDEIPPYLAQLRSVLAIPSSKADSRLIAEVERVLWPAKIVDSSLPSFIVSIKADWAARLFEDRLASQDLFGAEAELALRVQNAYYRSATPRVLQAPARVLWYVTQSTQYTGSMSIRAVSQVTNVETGLPKELYRRYKRLGVYEWKDVFGTARNDLKRPLMAFTFSNTELLRNPIHWDDVQGTMVEVTGKGSPLQGPVPIAGECFARLYRRGTTSPDPHT
jgi:predicted nucleic acid-binding protein